MMELLDWLLAGLIDVLILGFGFEFSWHVCCIVLFAQMQMQRYR